MKCLRGSDNDSAVKPVSSCYGNSKYYSFTLKLVLFLCEKHARPQLSVLSIVDGFLIKLIRLKQQRDPDLERIFWSSILVFY